jgi:cathepsin B
MCTQIHLCSSVSDAIDEVPVLDDDLIAQINSVAQWKAGRNPRFEGVTVAQAKKLLGAKVAPLPGTKTSRLSAPGALPTSFDSRKEWPGCVHPVRNQAQCGSCWAFGATESFRDRICIAPKNPTNVNLSPQWVVSCDQTDYGCQGGYLQNAWQFMAGTGVVTNNCDPYTSQNGNVAPCPSSCVDSSNINTKYFVNANSIQTLTDAPSMQTAIMKNGPVEAAFSVYQDFFSYTSGVYVHTSGQLMGGHAIKIVGWGVDTSSNQDYWIVYNSWGTSWGMNGLFWILRGANECGIESNCVIGLPK